MATRGWYPDPGGAPGRFRYWDGRTWSAETTDNPGSPPPVAGAPGSAPGSGRRRGAPGLLIGALVLAAVVALVLVLVIRSITGTDPLVDRSPPESTVSGWDDSSPLPTETATPSSSPTSADPQGMVSCNLGDPTAGVDHPEDGRVHGGGLSFAHPGGVWDEGQSYASGMSWAYDVDGVRMVVEESRWWAMLAVGAVHQDDGFPTPKKAASQIMQCIASSVYYQTFESREDLRSGAVTVDGTSGWSIRSEVRVSRSDIEADGDVVEVIVVDTGVQNQLAIFCGFVTIGEQDQIATLDATIDSLTVD